MTHSHYMVINFIDSNGKLTFINVQYSKWWGVKAIEQFSGPIKNIPRQLFREYIIVKYKWK